MINRSLLFAIFICFTAGVSAQKLAKVQSLPVHVVMLPDFYHYETVRNGDTTLTFDCYDKEMTHVRVDKLDDLKTVKTIFYFKNFYAYARKPGSMMSPPLLSKRMYKWERIDATTWLGVDDRDLSQMRFKEIRNKIVRSDTVTFVDPSNGKPQKVIHKYYKTTSSDGSRVAHDHKH